MSRRILIIGAGSIGRRHLRNLRALGEGRVRLSVCEPHLDRLAAAHDLGRVMAFADLDDALAEVRPHAALVCTPTSLHLQHARAAAAQGAHLFIEKPLSTDLSGTGEFLDLAAARRLLVMMGMCYRFHTGLLQVKQLLGDGVIGTLRSACLHAGHHLPDWRPGTDYRATYSARRSLGGGVLLDSIHSLDLARWLFGEAQEVVCMAGQYGNLGIETEDLASLVVQTEGGPLVEIHVDYLQRVKENRIDVIGSEGTLRWDYVAREIRWARADGAAGAPSGDEGWVVRRYAFEPNDMYRAEMGHFLECLETGRTPQPDGWEGRRTLRLAAAAALSAAQRRFVSLAELP